MDPTIELRAVERFPEPEFTQLVDRLLHDPDRKAIAERFLGSAGTAPPGDPARHVRIGAFAANRLVGWSHAVLAHGGVLYVSNSAVDDAYRRRGLYSRLIAAMEEQARALGCVRIESHHRTGNAAVLIAKLKAGYTITGTEFAAEMGLLVKMSKHLHPGREALLQARAGRLEEAARFFGRAGSDADSAGR